VNIVRTCPRCNEGDMQTWEELSADEQEVVKRLPASADYSAVERQGTHQWCKRCWYEATNDAEQTV
jgi:hypothetical protein